MRNVNREAIKHNSLAIVLSVLLFALQVLFFMSVGIFGLSYFKLTIILFFVLLIFLVRLIRNYYSILNSALILIPFVLVFFYVVYVYFFSYSSLAFGIILIADYYFQVTIIVLAYEMLLVSILKSHFHKRLSSFILALIISFWFIFNVDFIKLFFDNHSYTTIENEKFIDCDFSYVSADNDTISLRNNILDPRKIYLIDIWSVSCLPCREYHENVIIPTLSELKDVSQLEFLSVHAPCKDESCVQRYKEFIKKYNDIYDGSILPFEVTNWGDYSGILGNYIIVDNQIKYSNYVNSGLYEDDIVRLTKVLKSCLERNK